MDSKSAFVKRFGDLIALLRMDPGNDAAQDLALTAAVAAVESDPVEVEAGVQWSVVPDELTLKARLLARQVEVVRVAAGAEPHELLALARALSHDVTPIRSSANVHIDMVRRIEPPDPETGGAAPAAPPPASTRFGLPERRGRRERRRPDRGSYHGIERRRGGSRRAHGERRVQLLREHQAEIARLRAELAEGLRAAAWETVLGAAVALVRLAPKLPGRDRRMYGIQLRRAVPGKAIVALLDAAEQRTDLRADTAELLRWIGLDAAEVVLQRLLDRAAGGTPRLYYDVLRGMPDAYRLIVPLLSSPDPQELRHGAALLGRLRQPQGVAKLAPLVSHADPRVRAAAVRGIGRIHRGPAAEPLREALHHPDPRTRIAAAEAIAEWRAGALALLLVARLPVERDREVWQGMITALGAIGTAESCAALAGVATARRTLLRRDGYDSGQRVVAVRALGLSGSEAARAALERLERAGDAPVREAAARLLDRARRRAG